MRVFASHSEKRDLPRNCILRKAGVGEPPHLCETFHLQQNEKAERTNRTLAQDWRYGRTRESEIAGGLKPSPTGSLRQARPRGAGPGTPRRR